MQHGSLLVRSPVASRDMHIVYTRADEPGWYPITHMVHLLARLSRATLTEVPADRVAGRLERLASVVPRRRGAEDLLVVCPAPGHMQALTSLPRWWSSYRCVSAWVIDSWWDERIPQLARGARQFDRVWITEPENIDAWRSRVGGEVEHLPVGADVLGNVFDVDAPRPVDVLRVGRMPEGWDDDAEVARVFAEHGLRFAGRPPMEKEYDEGMRVLWEAERRAKFVLAFTNLVSPAPYTHPTSEYVTPRWADAISSGATTVGVLPRTATARSLWPAASLDVPLELGQGVVAIAEAAARWTPQVACNNRANALRVLDWRHRFKIIQQALGARWEALDQEVAELDTRQASLGA